MLTLKEAYKLGNEKLGINDRRWRFGLNKARELDVLPRDMGPMTLALALIGGHKMDKITDETLSAELTDALQLVAKAEKGWRLEQGGFRL